MGNIGTLITPQELNARLTPEKRRENASKAGKASAKAKQEKKRMIDAINALLMEKAQQLEKDGKVTILDKTNMDEVAAASVATAMRQDAAGTGERKFIAELNEEYKTTTKLEVGESKDGNALLKFFEDGGRL